MVAPADAEVDAPAPKVVGPAFGTQQPKPKARTEHAAAPAPATATGTDDWTSF